MANPTTNYGFVLPTSTDLVTDLPADFDVALQGVDTRLKALQPGTTLGDIAYSSATANTNTRLGIGTAGQVLTVASGVPSWATPGTGNTFVGCSVNRVANKNISNNTATKVDFDSENFDTNGFHDNSTNNTRLTIPSGQGGYYLITWNGVFEANVTGYRTAQIKKNNGSALGTGVITGLSSYAPAQNQLVLNLAAADYIELEVYQNSGTTIRLFCEAEWPDATILTIMRLGS